MEVGADEARSTSEGHGTTWHISGCVLAAGADEWPTLGAIGLSLAMQTWKALPRGSATYCAKGSGGLKLRNRWTTLWSAHRFREKS